MDEFEIEYLINEIRSSALGLSNCIDILNEVTEFKIDMYDEIIEYLKEKRGLQENG